MESNNENIMQQNQEEEQNEEQSYQQTCSKVLEMIYIVCSEYKRLNKKTIQIDEVLKMVKMEKNPEDFLPKIQRKDPQRNERMDCIIQHCKLAYQKHHMRLHLKTVHKDIYPFLVQNYGYKNQNQTKRKLDLPFLFSNKFNADGVLLNKQD